MTFPFDSPNEHTSNVTPFAMTILSYFVLYFSAVFIPPNARRPGRDSGVGRSVTLLGWSPEEAHLLKAVFQNVL